MPDACPKLSYIAIELINMYHSCTCEREKERERERERERKRTDRERKKENITILICAQHVKYREFN